MQSHILAPTNPVSEHFGALILHRRIIRRIPVLDEELPAYAPQLGVLALQLCDPLVKPCRALHRLGEYPEPRLGQNPVHRGDIRELRVQLRGALLRGFFRAEMSRRRTPRVCVCNLRGYMPSEPPLFTSALRGGYVLRITGSAVAASQRRLEELVRLEPGLGAVHSLGAVRRLRLLLFVVLERRLDSLERRRARNSSSSRAPYSYMTPTGRRSCRP